jgi:hypothetical protein
VAASTVWRRLSVLSLVVGPLVVAIGTFFQPALYEGSMVHALTEVARHRDAQRLLTAVDVLAMLMLPAVVVLTMLASAGSRPLAFVGGGLTFASWVAGLIALAGLDVFTLHAAAEPGREEAASLLSAYYHDPVTVLLLVCFVGGHTLGMMLLGAALWRSSSAPRAAAVLIGVVPVLHLFVHDTGNRIDALVYGLEAVGAVACAIAFARGGIRATAHGLGGTTPAAGR